MFPMIPFLQRIYQKCSYKVNPLLISLTNIQAKNLILSIMSNLCAFFMKIRVIPRVGMTLFMFFACFLAKNEVNAQRIYANSQVNDPGCIVVIVSICGNISNPAYPVTTANINAGQPSIITAPLALSSAFQTLNFGTAPPLLASNTPVTIKLKTTSVLGLANMISIQAVNGTNLVTPATSGSSLISLLNASDIVEYSFVPSAAYSGVRVTTGGTLSLASGASLYYAFYIAPPVTTTPTICSGQTATISVTNPQLNPQGTKYYYKWYTAATGGTLLKNSQDTFYSAALSASTDYYVVAVDSNAQASYSSARRKVTVTVNPFPTATVTTPTYVCHGLSAFKINYSNTTNSPNMYSIAWNAAATTAGFADVSYTTLTASPLNIPMPPTAPVSSYQGVFLLRNTNNCINTYPFSLIVQNPPDPHATTTFQ
jgi:hypothetical protein